MPFRWGAGAGRPLRARSGAGGGKRCGRLGCGGGGKGFLPALAAEPGCSPAGAVEAGVPEGRRPAGPCRLWWGRCRVTNNPGTGGVGGGGRGDRGHCPGTARVLEYSFGAVIALTERNLGRIWRFFCPAVGLQPSWKLRCLVKITFQDGLMAQPGTVAVVVRKCGKAYNSYSRRRNV